MATMPSPSIGSVRKDSIHAQEEGYDWKMEAPSNTRQHGNPDTVALSTAGSMASTSRRARRKDESLSYTIRQHIVNHQLGLSINCLAFLSLTHLLFPSLRSFTAPFFTLSHRDPETGTYHPGVDDFKFVSLWIVVFTGLRAGTMDNILIPWARNLGVGKRKSTVRFAEQAWMLIYYSVFWTLGMYLYIRSDYWVNLKAVWNTSPTSAMTGLFKWYYLAQFAFWLQQIVVVNIEDRRKDHWQMFTHHIITCTLMLTSYGYYQTQVGNVILCIMDVVDIILPAAKMMKYVGMQTACDIAFGIFIITWFLARHVVYLGVCWSVAVDFPASLRYGCYTLNTGVRHSEDGGNEVLLNLLHAYRGGEHEVCFNNNIRLAFLGLLLALQVLTVIWFGMICRVAYGVLSGKGAEDSRSDDEGEGEDEGEEAAEMADEVRIAYKSPKEEEVGVEELRLTSRRPSPAKTRKSKGRASGISIPGHSDHKELLGRIGCDKPGS